MNNRFTLTCIGLALALVLLSGASCSKRGNEIAVLPDLKPVNVLISENKLDEAREKIGEIAAKFPDSVIVGKGYFNLAEAYEKKKEPVKARDAYQVIFSKYQNIDNIVEVQEKVAILNIAILFSPLVTDRDVFYEVEPGDTLSKIARRFGTTVDLIKISNSLKDDMIKTRAKLKISKAQYKILIDKSQNLLTLFFDDGKILKAYSVSTGKNNSTPVGIFMVVNKMNDPVWYTQGAIVPAESPDNILGSRWLGLSVKGYGIHGTTEPDTVGQQVTAGCIRMLNSDVEELYAMIPIGTEVTVVD
ncbi:MAG: L,D-transpeptidase family protein [Candidatus Omnitrophica bacterium]|nr:L,D-transpeptidase family protein [Candidatus Omnitrophota bacterium]